MNAIAKANGFSIEEMNAWIVKNLLPITGNKGLVRVANMPGFPEQMGFRLSEQPMMAFDWTPNQQDVSRWIPTIKSSLPFYRDAKQQSLVLDTLKAEMTRLSEK